MGTPLTTQQARDPYRKRPGQCADCGTRVSPTNWSGMRVHAGRWLCTVRGGNREESCHEKSVRRAVEDRQQERRMEVDIWATEPPGGLHALHDSIQCQGKRFLHGMLDCRGVPEFKPRAVEHFNRVEYDSRPKGVSMARRILSVAQCAAIRGKSESHIKDAIARGEMGPPRRSGGENVGPYEIRPADFLAWLGRCGWNADELAEASNAIEASLSPKEAQSA